MEASHRGGEAMAKRGALYVAGGCFAEMAESGMESRGLVERLLFDHDVSPHTWRWEAVEEGRLRSALLDHRSSSQV